MINRNRSFFVEGVCEPLESNVRPQMISIRALMPADEDQVLTINAGAQPHVAPLNHVEFARLMGLSRAHLVAAERESVLGYALSFCRSNAYDGEEFLALKSLISAPFVYIDQVAVIDSAQGIGIGRRLYDAIEDAGREHGARCLCCEVNTMPPNPGSLAFHRRLGFSELSSFATRDGRNVVLLQKLIPEAP